MCVAAQVVQAADPEESRARRRLERLALYMESTSKAAVERQ